MPFPPALTLTNGHDGAKQFVDENFVAHENFYTISSPKDKGVDYYVEKLGAGTYIFQDVRCKSNCVYGIATVANNQMVFETSGTTKNDGCSEYTSAAIEELGLTTSPAGCRVPSLRSLRRLVTNPAYINPSYNRTFTTFTMSSQPQSAPPSPTPAEAEPGATTGRADDAPSPPPRAGTVCSSEAVKRLASGLAARAFERSPDRFGQEFVKAFQQCKTISTKFGFSAIRHRGANLDPNSGPVSCVGMLHITEVTQCDTSGRSTDSGDTDFAYTVENSDDGSEVIVQAVPDNTSSQ